MHDKRKTKKGPLILIHGLHHLPFSSSSLPKDMAVATALLPSPWAHVSIGRSGGTRRAGRKRPSATVRCGIADLIGGDLVKLDLGRWLTDVEKHKALAIYTPHEGGYEGRYLTRLRYQGYQFMDLSARGLGDPETTLTKIHSVCPVSMDYGLYIWKHSYNNKKLSILPPATTLV